MAWNTPNTSWSTPDIVGSTDLNEIGENLEYLKAGLAGEVGTSVSSGTNLDIAENHQTFSVTGSSSISYIYRGSRPYGQIINLIFYGTSAFYLVAQAGSIPSGYGHILSSSNIAINNQFECMSFICFTYGGDDVWVPIHKF